MMLSDERLQMLVDNLSIESIFKRTIVQRLKILIVDGFKMLFGEGHVMLIDNRTTDSRCKMALTHTSRYCSAIDCSLTISVARSLTRSLINDLKANMIGNIIDKITDYQLGGQDHRQDL